MSVKLYYFNGCGRAEVIRWILTYAGVQFEDNRVDKLDEIKSKLHWGQVPLVEDDGKALTQSVAITRYYAKKHNLVPEDPFQAAQCDEYVLAVQDIASPLYTLSFSGLPADEKTKKVGEAVESTKTRFFDKFDSIIKANGGGHLVGDKLTWADLWLAWVIDQFEILLKVNIAEGRENVLKLKEGVVNLPKIKEWIEKRPKTPF